MANFLETCFMSIHFDFEDIYIFQYANNFWTKIPVTGHKGSRIRTGSNQDFEIQQFGVKNQVLPFQSGFRDSTYLFKQNKQ